jgi:flagellar protein FlbD
VIKVTRLNDSPLVVNVDLIEFVESIPDTIISLTTGKKIMVKETMDQIIERVTDFKRQCSVRFGEPDAHSGKSGVENG